MLETARNVFYKSRTLSYEELARDHEFFVKTYPIVTKYMCNGMFDEESFQELLEKKETRVGFAESFKLQAEYLKSMLVKRGLSRMEANKISNLELGYVEKEINKIKKLEKQLKKRNASERMQNAEERRKEFRQFLLENPKLEDPTMCTGVEWLAGDHPNRCVLMVQRGEEVIFGTELTEVLPTDLVFLTE
jgi:hypothetical protein